MHRAHARIPAPEIYHFLDWTYADSVDERDGAGFGEGGPFGVFSGHEEVEGELFAHLGGRLVAEARNGTDGLHVGEGWTY